MTKREALRQTTQENTLMSLGFSRDDADRLRRISMTLHRWAEEECNGTIERDETRDNRPYRSYPNTGKHYAYRVPDREAGAMRRLTAIMAQHPSLTFYVQGDPRGAALYILRPGDVPDGKDVHGYYSRGIAVW